MSDRIEVGDLVVIVRGHECFMNFVGGAVFVVTNIVPPWNGGWVCQQCHTRSIASDQLGAEGCKPGAYVPLSWLKRIPPLSELERADEQEKAAA